MTDLGPDELVEYLRGLGIRFKIHEHAPAGTSEESFIARLRATGKPVIGAKALVLRVQHEGKADLVLAVLRGIDRLSSRFVRQILQQRFNTQVTLEFADSSEIKSKLRGLEPGRVPPLGPPVLPAIALVIVDQRLLAEPEVGFNAADSCRSIVLDTSEFSRTLSSSTVSADIAVAADPERGRPFHLAMPSDDLDATVFFYQAIGCRTGRRNARAVTFDFFGHQVVAHLDGTRPAQEGIYPRHFGLIVSPSELDRLERCLRIVTPESTIRRTRFPNSDLEHDALLARDPGRNQIEFKTYRSAGAALAPSTDPRIGDT